MVEGLHESAPESPEVLPELPPLKEALRAVAGEHLKRFLGMRAVYINIVKKPSEPNTNERVEGWDANPKEDPSWKGVCRDAPNPFPENHRYTVKTEDSGVTDPSIPVVGGKEDADRWIDQTIRQIEKMILADDMKKSYPNRKADHPLLMAVYEVLKVARGQEKGKEPITIPHDVCMNLARELDDIYPRDVETGFMAEGDRLMEAILALGEKYKLIIDKRRPQLVETENPSGNQTGKVVKMGYKYDPVRMALDLSRATRAKVGEVMPKNKGRWLDCI